MTVFVFRKAGGAEVLRCSSWSFLLNPLVRIKETGLKIVWSRAKKYY
jgi:hypothetical protein